jgi:hypothetical protein
VIAQSARSQVVIPIRADLLDKGQRPAVTPIVAKLMTIAIQVRASVAAELHVVMQDTSVILF